MTPTGYTNSAAAYPDSDWRALQLKLALKYGEEIVGTLGATLERLGNVPDGTCPEPELVALYECVAGLRRKLQRHVALLGPVVADAKRAAERARNLPRSNGAR